MPVKNDALAELSAGAEEQQIALSPFQQRACCVPEDFNLALTGSRGGGKSYLICVLVMRYIVKYGDRARVLFVRQSHAGCEDFVMICRELFGRVWGNAVRFNANDGIWRGFPGGGTLEISQLSNQGEYQKFQGRSFTLICVDEMGQFDTDELPLLLRSNLRGPADVPKRMIVASNPCGVGHSWIYKKHIVRTTAWHPYLVDGQTWVTAPSLFTDNIFIDADQYRRDLEAACSFDGQLLMAFRDGRWDVVRGGAFFAQCLNEERVMFAGWKLPEGVTARRWLQPKATPCGDGIVLAEPDLEPWMFWLAMDWGYSAPCICYLCGRSPGATVDGRWYPRGSVLLLDEVSTARPGRKRPDLRGK